ncbi:MAG: hypothetical protein WD061_01325 [Candidatus Saccharimonadales bacterium]
MTVENNTRPITNAEMRERFDHFEQILERRSRWYRLRSWFSTRNEGRARLNKTSLRERLANRDSVQLNGKLLPLAVSAVLGLLAGWIAVRIGLSLSDRVAEIAGTSLGWLALQQIVITILAILIGIYTFRWVLNYFKEDQLEESNNDSS